MASRRTDFGSDSDDYREAMSGLVGAGTHGARAFVMPPADGFGGSVEWVGVAATEFFAVEFGLFGFLAGDRASRLGARVTMMPPPAVGRAAQKECTKEPEK